MKGIIRLSWHQAAWNLLSAVYQRDLGNAHKLPSIQTLGHVECYTRERKTVVPWEDELVYSFSGWRSPLPQPQLSTPGLSQLISQATQNEHSDVFKTGLLLLSHQINEEPGSRDAINLLFPQFFILKIFRSTKIEEQYKECACTLQLDSPIINIFFTFALSLSVNTHF